MGIVFSAATALAGAASAATVDLLQFRGDVAAVAIIHEVRIGQSGVAGDALAEMIPISWSFTDTFAGTGTSIIPWQLGTGNATAVHDAIDAVATISTSLTAIGSDTMNLQGGFLYLPAPEDRIEVPAVAAEGIVFQCPAPDNSTTWHVTVVYEEFKIT